MTSSPLSSSSPQSSSSSYSFLLLKKEGAYPPHLLAKRLNNRGCLQIEEGQFDEAIVTLVKALKLSEEASSSLASSSSSSLSSSPQCCRCRQCSLAASLAFSSSRTRQSKSGDKETSSSSSASSDKYCQNCTTTSSSSSSAASATKTPSVEDTDETDDKSRHYLYQQPIRVDPTLFHNGHNMGVTLSLMIIFNLALAHHLNALRAVASSSSSSNNNKNHPAKPDMKLLKKALQLYELAYQLHVDEQQTRNDGQDDDEDDDFDYDNDVHHRMGMLRFTMIISNNLGEIHRVANNPNKHTMCLQHLLSTLMYMVVDTSSNSYNHHHHHHHHHHGEKQQQKDESDENDKDNNQSQNKETSSNTVDACEVNTNRAAESVSKSMQEVEEGRMSKETEAHELTLSNTTTDTSPKSDPIIDCGQESGAAKRNIHDNEATMLPTVREDQTTVQQSASAQSATPGVSAGEGPSFKTKAWKTLEPFWHAIKQTTTSPGFIAMVLAFITACIPPLQRALFEPGGALRFFGSAMEALGTASSPISTIVVAASLVPPRPEHHSETQQDTDEDESSPIIDERPGMTDPNFGPYQRPRRRQRNQRRASSSRFSELRRSMRSSSMRILQAIPRSTPEMRRLHLWFNLSRLFVTPAVVVGLILALDCSPGSSILSNVPNLAKLVIIINSALPGALIVVVLLKAKEELADTAAAVSKVYLPSYLISIFSIAAWSAIGLWVTLPDENGNTFCQR